MKNTYTQKEFSDMVSKHTIVLTRRLRDEWCRATIFKFKVPFSFFGYAVIKMTRPLMDDVYKPNEENK